MSATPARDALIALAQDEHHDDGLVYADTFADRALAHPDLMLAALIESGWEVTDDQLLAMGGERRMFLVGPRGAKEAVWFWRFPKEANDG